MPCVLLLLNTEPNFQTRKTVDLIRREIGSNFQLTVRSLGRGGDFRSVADAALHLRTEPFDLVHAWGIPGVNVAALVSAKPILFSATKFPSRKSINWIGFISRYRNVHFVASSNSEMNFAIRHGLASSQCHFIPPAAESKYPSYSRNDELRTKLGFSPEDFVLIAPGESTLDSAHSEAVWATGILNVLDPRYHLLLWGRGDHAASAARLADRLRQSSMIKVGASILGRDCEFEDLLPAADACLITSTDPSPSLVIATCMKSGPAIVSIANPTTREMLSDNQTALLVEERSPRLIAQRVLDLRDNPTSAQTLKVVASTEAEQKFNEQATITHFRQLYSQFTPN